MAGINLQPVAKLMLISLHVQVGEPKGSQTLQNSLSQHQGGCIMSQELNLLGSGNSERTEDTQPTSSAGSILLVR